MVVESPKDFEKRVIQYIIDNDAKWYSYLIDHIADYDWETLVRKKLREAFGNSFGYRYIDNGFYQVIINNNVIMEQILI